MLVNMQKLCMVGSLIAYEGQVSLQCHFIVIHLALFIFWVIDTCHVKFIIHFVMLPIKT